MRRFNQLIWVVNLLLAVLALEILTCVYPQLTGVKRVMDWVGEFTPALVIIIIYFWISLTLPGLRGCAGVFLGFASLGAVLAVFIEGPEPIWVAWALVLPALIAINFWASWRDKRLKVNTQSDGEIETTMAIE